MVFAKKENRYRTSQIAAHFIPFSPPQIKEKLVIGWFLCKIMELTFYTEDVQWAQSSKHLMKFKKCVWLANLPHKY
jgi:hypothetical protein